MNALHFCTENEKQLRFVDRFFPGSRRPCTDGTEKHLPPAARPLVFVRPSPLRDLQLRLAAVAAVCPAWVASVGKQAGRRNIGTPRREPRCTAFKTTHTFLFPIISKAAQTAVSFPASRCVSKLCPVSWFWFHLHLPQTTPSRPVGSSPSQATAIARELSLFENCVWAASFVGMSLGISFLNRPRSASSASDSKPGRKNKNLQPVFEFTNYIEGLNGKYSGRSGTGDRKPYVPEFELRKYWTKSRVYEICKSHAPHLTIKFEVVSERCLRLFSVLVYLDRVVYFDPLLERGISDAKLPLADADVPQTLRAAPAFKDVLDGLLEYQWMFCPLVIDYAQLTNLQLQPSHILPFHDEEKIADGDAAHIYRILVDKHCNKLNEVRTLAIASFSGCQRQVTKEGFLTCNTTSN